ncbi:MAG: acylneuraminate cytidylyltransferase [Bdellovibrionaceae bacterium]|nr:acylneuraminate cytidylyltransferase [Pseudobdellovibrionaceae bacterium]
MKLLIAFSLIALTLTTGFTCAKNTPEAAKQEAPAQDPAAAQPSQEQMATPPADGTAAPAAPTEAPATEEKK